MGGGWGVDEWEAAESVASALATVEGEYPPSMVLAFELETRRAAESCATARECRLRGIVVLYRTDSILRVEEWFVWRLWVWGVGFGFG